MTLLKNVAISLAVYYLPCKTCNVTRHFVSRDFQQIFYDTQKRKDSAGVQTSKTALLRALAGTACFYLLAFTQRSSFRSNPSKVYSHIRTSFM